MYGAIQGARTMVEGRVADVGFSPAFIPIGAIIVLRRVGDRWSWCWFLLAVLVEVVVCRCWCCS